MEGALADHGTGPETEVEDRSEAQIHTHGAELRGHDETAQVRHASGFERVAIMKPSERGARWERGEPGAKSLHRSALVVHGDQERRALQGVQRRA